MMDQHQILTGAVNAGDNCYSVGSVESVPFTAYSAGCNIVVLASDFQRVQIIPGILHGNVQVGCIDCSNDVGKIAAAYGKKICIFEPTPLFDRNSSHKLDYKWIQTASIETDCFTSVLSWNLEGSKLLTGGSSIQMWNLVSSPSQENEESTMNESFQQDAHFRVIPPTPARKSTPNSTADMSNRPYNLHLNENNRDGDDFRWDCVWQCRTSSPVCFLRFSPDGSLFVSAGKSDRLVKIWFESAAKMTDSFNPGNYTSFSSNDNSQSHKFEAYHPLHQHNEHHHSEQLPPRSSHQPINDINYSFIYIAHPRAITGISWRKTSKYLPRGSVANMLVTSCRDNICRLWVQTLLPDDGLVNFSQIESLSNHTVPRNQTQRHRQKLLQRLKHMKSFSQFKKRQAVNHSKPNGESGVNGIPRSNSSNQLGSGEPIPTLPSTFSVHDFHNFSLCGTAVTPGFHFHLAASINAETDIPLVPSLSTNDAVNSSSARTYPNFVMHWLNNKEMVFTRAAERLLQDISVKIMQVETASALSGHSEGEGSDAGECEGDPESMIDNIDAESTITAESSKKLRHRLCHKVNHHKNRNHPRKAHHHSSGDHKTHSTKIDSEETSTSNDNLGYDSQPHSARPSAPTISLSASATNDLNNLAATGSASHSSASISDMLDRRFESMLREWNSLSDLLFSIHPVDGSLLVWLVQWLDEAVPGSFRQAQVNFSSRIPNAIPLGDAATMSHNLALYSPLIYLDLKSTLAQTPTSPRSESSSNLETKSNSEAHSATDSKNPQVNDSITPAVYMVTKHNNGSLNLWTISFAEVTRFTQLMSISHANRVCGHRFRVNDISCHPVLPLLLTTSHHNLPNLTASTPKSDGSSVISSPTESVATNSSCLPPFQSLPNSGFCSELILWKVDPVGPLSRSGGVTELARINSLETSAFANVAWIPTLLPSTTLGSISNSPSACFIASDGHQLRVYQAVIDARTLLSELSVAQRYSETPTVSATSEDTTSSDIGGIRADLNQVFKIVSLQSTSRPGCILELDSISDATHDWQHTQLLHVFQDKLLRGDQVALNRWREKHDRAGSNLGFVEPNLGAVVDLRHNAVFREPFFLTVLEKDEHGRSVLHMWKLIISSAHPSSDLTNDRFSYVPDSNLIQDESDLDQSSPSGGSPLPDRKGGDHDDRRPSKTHSIRGTNQSISPLQIVTTKVCTQVLPLPEDVEILHATPSAGHLSSSNIYPACFAPYLICTACSDGTLRFWRCKVEENSSNNDDSRATVNLDCADDDEISTKYTWIEWEMLISKKKSSAIDVPGLPLYVSCAYSGRLACAYKHGQSFSRPTSKDPQARYMNINLAIYECESTGGSEWVLEDTIHLKNIVIPETDQNQQIDLAPLINTTIRNRKTRDTLLHRLSSSDEHAETNKSATNIQRLLSVPSCSTMQSLKKIIAEQGNQFTLTQKSIVQLDWVSTEDGSHILSVSVGDKISVFTPVSTDIAQANLQAMNSTKTGAAPQARMLLKQMSSMATLSQVEDIRWMKLRTTNLRTADSLPPLPMQMSWVRDGILVVGMDNEMHIYTQWKSQSSFMQVPISEVVDSRILTEEGLLIHAQESSHLRLPSHTPLPRSPSSSVISSLSESKKHASNLTMPTVGGGGPSPGSVNQVGGQHDISKNSCLSQFPDFGIFEASRLACPVLPQYHPKQLMELLSFGKISRVRAILSHLVKSLCSMDSLKNYLNPQQSSGFGGETRARSWTRSRTLSVAAPPASPGAPSPLEAENYFPTIPEEVQLDYTEITSIRPLPLFALVETESEKIKRISDRGSSNSKDSLFDINSSVDLSNQSKSQVDETLDEMMGRSAFSFGSNKSKKNESSDHLMDFNPHQARLLTKILTHSHLPGLSSLDQMHLLALADAVASFDPQKEPGSDYLKASDTREEQLISADSLDDCGLRFLLTMRQHTYLLRCLPFAHRRLLQKNGLSSASLVWAFHSETQEELVQLIPSVSKGAPKWTELKELGAGWWIRSNFVLKRLIEQTAKAAFQMNQDPLDAALFYLAMKKKSLVWGLYRSTGDKKMTDFFQNNFTDDKWRRAALKNAYALLGKQRFDHAAAFFLLGGSVWDAIEVCMNKLNDLQLAMVIVRLYEGDIETIPSNLKRILYQEILGCEPDGSNFDIERAHPDPFLRSMAYWMLQDYTSALTTLLETEAGSRHPKFVTSSDNRNSFEGNLERRAKSKENQEGEKQDAATTPSVFNFYLYLRNQPLILRRHLAQTLKEKRNGAKEKEDMIREASEAITPFERRLYFLTAHQHFLAGCPSLALEVLSRLPHKITNDDSNVFLKRGGSIDQSVDNGDEIINTAMLPSSPTPGSATVSKTEPEKSDSIDWGAPMTDFSSMSDFKIDITIDAGSDEEDEENMGLQMKVKSSDKSSESEVFNDGSHRQIETSSKLDIMAQQLKFIACLKILMEELSTLATGFEVDGGRLRYHLYLWLEKSVIALKETCNYRTFSMRGSDNEIPEKYEPSPKKTSSMILDDGNLAPGDFLTPRGSHSEVNGSFGEFKPTLHEVLLAENLDFEAKLQRAARRKEWLQGNEALLRTLLSYCSLHGAHGGGLSSVRMELILLLQELQQERSQHQLLSPLPFPTTLPLLAASVACQKTVIADPIRHLHSVTNDILTELTGMKIPPLSLPMSYCEVFVLRDLGLSLSACVYQSLSNSDNLELKNTNIKEDLLGASVVCANSHLLAGNHSRRGQRICSESNEPLQITTPPSKWPGVQSLRALLARDKDEDSPKLHTLLCEAYVGIYMSQLVFCIAACDAHVLYRLVGLEFNESVWSNLFGGGAKKLIHVITQKPQLSPASSVPLNKDDQTLGVLTSLSQQRMKLHMKILQQLNQDKPSPPPSATMKEDRTTYKEQFVPPQMSIISFLMSKPKLTDEWGLLDYDSTDSDQSEAGDSDDEFDAVDDIFNDTTDLGTGGETKRTADSINKKSEIEQYAWGIIRYAVIKLARFHLAQFLSISGVEIRDLPTTSPLIHSIFKVLEMWCFHMKKYMDRFPRTPPNFLPNTFVESTPHTGGPPIWKYKVLLEMNNTPFRSHNSISKPQKRLWNYLVRQDKVQDLFIRYIFGKSKVNEVPDTVSNGKDDGNEASPVTDPTRIVHKDQDNISAFCINSTQSGLISLATPKEIIEMDISSLLETTPWLEEEAEYDILNMSRASDPPASCNYLMVQHPADKLAFSPGSKAMSTQSISASPHQQKQKATPLLKRHRTEGTRRLCAHPTLPYYLSGSQDGSVHLWEWRHQNALASPRPPGTFAKVTKVSFNQIGNKFGVTDGDGNLSLWQVSLCTSGSKPFYSMQVHSKIASDFTFLGSSSLIITAGQSNDHKNVCMWDTLLPSRKSLVTSFACHEHHGASVVLYTPLNQLLITGGKKGEVFIFDMRQRVQRNKFQAHDSAIKCICLDPGEEFFVTGSADGDIKVWSLVSLPVALYSFPGEHTRSTIFRNIGMGVSHLSVDNDGRLFSCGADGSFKMRQLPEFKI
ncbi:rabconnectin-3 alpha isoform X2 [Brevipalpus obovatus]|uniref:rabconnectin-3 alpha isoform X2 n=1 Tax=Brevipalpus obovatus TaxID=246614 RepID=UPI003D9EEBFD